MTANISLLLDSTEVCDLVSLSSLYTVYCYYVVTTCISIQTITVIIANKVTHI